MEKRLVKIGDAAAMLGVAVSTLRKWESTGNDCPPARRQAARDITTPTNYKGSVTPTHPRFATPVFQVMTKKLILSANTRCLKLTAQQKAGDHRSSKTLAPV